MFLAEQGVRFKAIGKAAIQGTKQIGKTLTAMSDSPDKRGRGKLAEIKDARFSQREKRKRKSKRKSVVKETDQSLGLDTSKFIQLCCFVTMIGGANQWLSQALGVWLLRSRVKCMPSRAQSIHPTM